MKAGGAMPQHKNAVDDRFVSKRYAKKHPKTTYQFGRKSKGKGGGRKRR
jgi:hypothetical protein